jgi:hypothetical protein
MKSIKQLADEIGVSKTAVRKQIENLGLRSSLRKNGNQFAISELQESLILKAFMKDSQTKIGNQSETNNTEVSDLLFTLQNTISMLQEQLNVKDQQIQMLNERLSDMTSALAVAQQTAAASQALHAGTIQQQIEYKDKRERSGIWPWRKR